MITSWKTSLIGITALVIGAVLLILDKINWEQFILFISLFGIGMTAKDHNVTGGSKRVVK